MCIDPIENVTVSGNSWLQHGEVLNLQVKCVGSPPYEYCVNMYDSQHNMTDNEKCNGSLIKADTCEFPVQHFFKFSSINTIVLIIKNQVTTVRKEITINIYDAKKQSQLSVIVVPVACSLFAVILVVFGVAYYIQNRRRYVYFLFY